MLIFPNPTQLSDLFANGLNLFNKMTMKHPPKKVLNSIESCKSVEREKRNVSQQSEFHVVLLDTRGRHRFNQGFIYDRFRKGLLNVIVFNYTWTFDISLK